MFSLFTKCKLFVLQTNFIAAKESAIEMYNMRPLMFQYSSLQLIETAENSFTASPEETVVRRM